MAYYIACLLGQTHAACIAVAGSGKRYMAHKNNLLAEQFQVMAEGLANSVTGPLAASRDLFRGISIHVNGFTRPSNLVSFGTTGLG